MKASLLLVLFFVQPVRAAFESKPAGARAAALSNAGEPDALSVFANPARTADLDRPEISSFEERLFGLPDLSYEGAAAALPGRSGTWTVAYDRFGVPEYREQEVLLSRGFILNDAVAFGATLKGLLLRIEDFGSASTWAADAGLSLRLQPHWTASFSARNLNHPSLGPVSPSSGFLAALSWQAAGFLRLEGDLEQSAGGPLSFRSGLETTAGPVSFRGGWSDSPAAFSGGFGVRLGAVRLDYAYIQNAALSASHVLTLGLRFGRRAPRRIKTPPAPPPRLNLLTATEDDLTALPGIGRVTAEKIVRFRDENGLKEFDDLLEIPGLRRAQFLELKDRAFIPAPDPPVGP